MDMEKLAAALAPVIRGEVSKATQPLLERIAELEARKLPEAIKGDRGEDGKDGRDGSSVSVEDVERMVQGRVAEWALDFERRAQGVLERAVDRIPKPADGKDGRDGSDGRDGLGFDDLSVDHDGERGLTIKFTRDDICKEFKVSIPVAIDRGVYKADAAYERGDGVSFGGSFWIAQKNAPDGKPGMSGDWRLAVKKGRDGKDGRNGIDLVKPVKGAE